MFAVSIGTGLIGTAAQKKRPLYVPDFTKESRYKPWGKKTRSELAIPLMVRDEVVGVLDCQSENPDHFDSETVDLLTLFSTQASMALQNARLYSLERRRASQLEAINTVARGNYGRAGRERTAVESLRENSAGVRGFSCFDAGQGRRGPGAAGAPWRPDPAYPGRRKGAGGGGFVGARPAREQDRNRE